MILNVTAINTAQYNEIIESKQKAVINFSAPWCTICHMLSFILDEMSKEFEDTKFYSIDVEQEEALSKKLNIAHVPAILAYVSGEEVLRRFGFKDKNDIKARLKDVLG